MNKEKRKIKLVIVINDFLIGGAQRLIVELLLYINRDRFDVTLVTLAKFEKRETMYHLLPSGIPVCKLGFKGFRDIRNWIALGKLLKKERPDVVLSHLFFSNTVVRLLNIFIKFRTITVEHNTYVATKWWQIWSACLLSHLSYKIVAVSPTVMEFASHQQHVSLEKFVVIKNGIDVQTLARKAGVVDKFDVKRELQVLPEDKIIISVGRLTGQKDPLLLIDGFARFVRSCPNYHLVIMGDGTLRSDMEKQVEARGVSAKVHFLGNVSNVVRYYAAADFLISTSLIEGLSMAHLEALACKLPLLTTRTAGSEELVKEDENGFFITESTPEAVEKGLRRMDGALMKTMRENAYKVAERYDVRRTVSEYEKLLTDIADK